MTPAGPVLLRCDRLSKRFGGTQALDSVGLAIRAGEIHALLGENGAGKSTLIKILAGIYVADDGAIEGPAGKAGPGKPVPGIAFVHQDLGLVETMTVAENVAVVADYQRKRGLIDWGATEDKARHALDAMGCTFDPGTLVGRLSAAEKSMVAIARALAIEARILVLDEPTATLPESDVIRLHEVLQRLRGQGLGIIYVTHRLDEVFRIADTVTVLRDGKVVSSRPVGETTPQGLVMDIVGRGIEELFPAIRHDIGDVVLAVEDLKSKSVGPVSFEVAAGEILGLVGLRSAGHDVVGRIIAGALPSRSGDIRLDGKRLTLDDSHDAIVEGIGFVSSKRTEESICAGLAVRENLFPDPDLAGISVIGTQRERQMATDALDTFDVRPRDTERPIATLSGGNQQKVVIARWLTVGRRVLVLEEPTTGVDVGAKAEIYRLLNEALSRKLAVLLVSSDFEEVAGLSDRALVFSRGQTVAEVPRADLSVERLTALASGGAV
ncbi:sugar ABC transporter ATP-binding protein [Bauldia litoralis]|uniref:Ribose transport system ATP-binding protein n=1 Tax=Bauldia litoralis TaxID=665467 RepID=A0A1G6EB70_9HYPH|nr:sugar ABC transporter ATP-binding protein [Bauldia litoralis]SDB54646.1 ribose transport system ATP-binding protein [Bauldia litoralis]